jgi:plastocyanin
MKRVAYLSALALVLLVLVAQSAGAAGRHTAQHTATVYIRDFYFSPANIIVEPGTTVTWVNRGRHPHTVTSLDGQFDSGVLMPGDRYKVEFKGHDTLGYYCAIHPSMRGSVVVGATGVVERATPATGGGGRGGGGRTMGPRPMPMPSGY